MRAVRRRWAIVRPVGHARPRARSVEKWDVGRLFNGRVAADGHRLAMSRRNPRKRQQPTFRITPYRYTYPRGNIQAFVTKQDRLIGAGCTP